MEVYEGKVQRIFTDKNGFAVFSFQIDKGPLIKCVGEVLLTQGEGEHLKLEGDWTNHDRFGRQFKISRFEKPIPIGKEAIIEFLGSGVVKGIKKAFATKIVAELGEDALDRILDEGPSALASIKGVGKKKADDIHKYLKENVEVQKIMTKLIALGLSPNLSMKVYKKFGDKCLMILQQNPYKLMQLPLVGFATADEFAQKIGFAPDSLFRVQAGLKHVLDKSVRDSGHSYIFRHQWIEGARQVLKGVAIPDHVLDDAASNLETHKEVVVETVRGEVRVYPKGLWYAEKIIAEWVARRLEVPPLNFPGLEGLVGQYEREMGIILSQKQKEAVRCALVSSLFVLTGGPGTGKTTVTKAILWCYNKLHPPQKVSGYWNEIKSKSKTTALCAPTGRAARRMEEVTGHRSSTIHRLLGIKGPWEPNEFNKDNPLPADFVVCDEFSMVDTSLGENLFQAIPDTAQVILVGDVNQLPSVGPGQLLRDLIDMGVPCTKLDVVQRQAQNSNIVVNAHRIHHGDTIVTGNDFFFVPKADNDSIKERLLGGVRKLLSSGWSSEDIQILTAMKKGDLGTYELNRVLQETMNPAAPEKPQVSQGGRILRVGDKVMQMVNNYDKQVFNGDIGVVRSITKKDDEYELQIEFVDGMKEYTRDKWSQLEHAYAVSIHKSQGGEYPVVLMPITTSHYVMLYRNLIYTGVTRAKKLCGIIGMQKAWKMAVENEPLVRNSGLVDRVASHRQFVNNVRGRAQ